MAKQGKKHAKHHRPGMKPEEDPQFFESHCLGKQSFPTENAAETYRSLAIHDPDMIGEITRADTLEAYQCMFSTPEEPHWHLGHA